MSPFDFFCVFFIFLGGIELFNPPISKNILCFISLLPCFFLTAFRDSHIGCDTGAYLWMFNSVAHANSLYSAFTHSRMEPGFVILNYIVSHLGFTFYQLQFVISCLYYTSLFFFLSKFSKNVGLSCFLFLTLRYMLGSMNVTRMYLAVAVLLFAVYFLQKNMLKQFVLCVFLASLFHKTAFIFILIYPLLKIELSTKLFVAFILCGTTIGIFGKNVMQFFLGFLNIYEGYLNSHYFNINGNIAIYITLAIDACFALFLYYNKLQMESHESIFCEKKEDYKLIKICNVAFLLIIFFDLVGLGNAIMSRITGYFSFCWLILIPLTIMKIRNRSAAIVMYIILVVCLLVQYKTVMILRPNWNCVEPYYTYLGDLF